MCFLQIMYLHALQVTLNYSYDKGSEVTRQCLLYTKDEASNAKFAKGPDHPSKQTYLAIITMTFTITLLLILTGWIYYEI